MCYLGLGDLDRISQHKPVDVLRAWRGGEGPLVAVVMIEVPR
jgi:hypothetical protein